MVVQIAKDENTVMESRPGLTPLFKPKSKAMKKLLVLLIISGVSSISCRPHVMTGVDVSKDASAFPEPTSTLIDECKNEKYEHRMEAEIAAMTPAQKINEAVNEHIYHMPSSDDHQMSLINKYILKDDVKILPTIIESINNYDPRRSSSCDGRNVARFLIASSMADDLDNVVRLRGIRKGKMAIEALERAIERMRRSAFDQDTHSRNSDFKYSVLLLDSMKGINVRDEMISDTLKERHNISMSERELLMFSNYLISVDSRYPTWSAVGSHGPPSILADSQKYYQAYLKFKGVN